MSQYQPIPVQQIKVVRSVEELPDLSGSRGIVIDTETSGVEPHLGDRMCGISIGPLGENVGYYIPIRHAEFNVPLEPVLAWLRTLGDDLSHLWVGHNLKFDLGILRADGIELRGNIIDTMIVGHVLRGDLFPNMYAIDKLTTSYVPGFKHEWWEKVHAHLRVTQPEFSTDEGRTNFNFSLVPIELLAPYALEDIHACRLLARAFNTNFDNMAKEGTFPPIDNYGYVSYSIHDLVQREMRLVKALFEMEYTGIRVDVREALRLRDKANGECEMFMQNMRNLCGFSFAPSAWKQTQIAFERSGGTIKYWNKTKEKKGKQKSQQYTENKEESTGRPNLNAAAIMSYLQEYPAGTAPHNFMVFYRDTMQRQRIVATYLDSYLKFCDFDTFLHCSFNQHTVVTGRLSSSHPNLQNVGKKSGTIDQKKIEKMLGKKDEEAVNRKLRGLFIARPGHLLVSLDWSQVEYRVAAWLAQDETMIRLWQENPKLDYHDATAEMTGLGRDESKTINFMVLYGGGAAGLAATLCGMGLPTTKVQAQGMLNQLFTARPALRKLMIDLENDARRDHYVQNLFGRICDIPVGMERLGLSFKGQGTTGDAMRLKIVEMSDYIREQKFTAKLLLTVHDELIFDVPEDKVLYEVPLLHAKMQECNWMSIPLVSDCEIGTSWGNMESFEDWKKTRGAA